MNDQGPVPAYSAPALDKALDILELLAGQSEPMTQTAIADAVGRNVSQIYRVLATLERRGYLLRDPSSGQYGLSMALFDLAHRHPPLRGLVRAADPPMRRLADEVRQSCNLSVVDGGAVRIVAQAESPADFGFRVRVGALFPLESTAAGAVLSGAGPLLTRADARQPGITDIVAAISGPGGGTLAALTVPYVSTSYSAVPVEAVEAAARTTADEITELLGGERRIAGRCAGVGPRA